MKFKVGDKVKISKFSEYYGRGTAYNPSNVKGVVIWDNLSDDMRGFMYRVRWPEGENSYRYKDLEAWEEIVIEI